MRWRRFSRTDSRKNPARAISAFVLLLTASALPAQLQHETTIGADAESLGVTVTVAGADLDTLFTTLEEGMRARVEFRVRISVPRGRPLRILGDQLLREFRPGIEARYDPFLSAYVLVSDDGTTAVYHDEVAFYADLFTLRNYRIPWSAIRGNGRIIVETSVEYTPIVFVPGLSILSLFTANRSETSAWSRDELAAQGADP